MLPAIDNMCVVQLLQEMEMENFSLTRQYGDQCNS